MRQLISEPLLHFLLLGLLLFATNALLNPGAQESAREIVITAPVLDDARASFERAWGRRPNAEELQEQIDAWVREEILYREAMAMGLGDGDPVVRRRLEQKMMMLAEARAETEPSEAALADWFAPRRAQYRRAARLSLEQRFFASGPEDARARAEAALAVLRTDGSRPVGDASLLPQRLEAVTLSYVEQVFGTAVAQAAQGAPLDSWVGPVSSSFGHHLLRIGRRDEGAEPSLQAVREEVLQDWAAAQKAQARRAYFRELRAGYTVRKQLDEGP